jgi:hypothetical protein
MFGFYCVAKIKLNFTIFIGWLIEDLYLISSLNLELAKSSYGWSSLWQQINIPKKNTSYFYT